MAITLSDRAKSLFPSYNFPLSKSELIRNNSRQRCLEKSTSSSASWLEIISGDFFFAFDDFRLASLLSTEFSHASSRDSTQKELSSNRGRQSKGDWSKRNYQDFGFDLSLRAKLFKWTFFLSTPDGRKRRWLFFFFLCSDLEKINKFATWKKCIWPIFHFERLKRT